MIAWRRDPGVAGYTVECSVGVCPHGWFAHGDVQDAGGNWTYCREETGPLI